MHLMYIEVGLFKLAWVWRGTLVFITDSFFACFMSIG